MKNVIDKDVNLFLPKKYNFLLLGGNFLLSKRLYEITKRQFEIKRLDYEFSSVEEYFPCIDALGFDIYIEPAQKIQTMVDLYNSNFLILTSEILLFLNDSKFKEFLEVIKQLKKIKIKIIFISIDSPLHLCKNSEKQIELTNMFSKSWYKSRINDLEDLLDASKDLVYNCSSYITYLKSNIQANIVDLLKTDQQFELCLEDSFSLFDLHISDDIIDDLILKINDTGRTNYKGKNSTKVNLFFIKNSLTKNELFTHVLNQSNCSVNLIYRKKSYEIENDRSVANWRYDLGCSLAKNVSRKIIDEIDIIVPVPETGKYYAQGLSNSLEKPYIEALYKKSEIGRSFDIANTEKREKFLYSKLSILQDLVADKVVGIVDEAIFTGQTLRLVKNLLDSSLVKKIYFFIASPECVSKCNYNMMPDRVLLSSVMTRDEIIRYFDVEGIIYQDLIRYKNLTKLSSFTCSNCFEKNEYS